MLRLATAILLAAVLSWETQAEEIKATGGSADEMVLGVWPVPPGFIANPEKLPVTFRSKENPSAVYYDTRDYFEKSGVPFPPGAFATINVQSSKILVRNTRDNLDLAEVIFGGCGIGMYGMPFCEIQAFECDLTSLARENVNSPPTYADLKRLPPSAIKLIDQVSAISKSGHTAELRSYRSTPPPGGQAPATPALREQLERQERFADDDSGTLAAIETVVGPDGFTCDISLSCRIKIPSDKGGSVEFKFQSNFVHRENQPLVIYSAPLPGTGGKTLVVVANTQMIDWDGSKLVSQFAAPEMSR